MGSGARGSGDSFVIQEHHTPLVELTRAGAVLLPESLAAAAGGPRTRLIVASMAEALPAVADLSTAEGPAAAVAAAVDPLGGLDLLVVNSGGPPPGSFERLGGLAPALPLHQHQPEVPGRRAVGFAERERACRPQVLLSRIEVVLVVLDLTGKRVDLAVGPEGLGGFNVGTSLGQLLEVPVVPGSPVVGLDTIVCRERDHFGRGPNGVVVACQKRQADRPPEHAVLVLGPDCESLVVETQARLAVTDQLMELPVQIRNRRGMREAASVDYRDACFTNFTKFRKLTCCLQPG